MAATVRRTEIPVYNKYYKRYAARVKARQIKEADFKKWKYQALTLRDDCADGKNTVEEYIQWMEGYFPRPDRTNKKSLLIELKRSNRRDSLLCEISGAI